MEGICNTCKHFRSNSHPNEEKLHHCSFQDMALSESESRQNCDECVPQGDIAKG